MHRRGRARQAEEDGPGAVGVQATGEGPLAGVQGDPREQLAVTRVQRGPAHEIALARAGAAGGQHEVRVRAGREAFADDLRLVGADLGRDLARAAVAQQPGEQQQIVGGDPARRGFAERVVQLVAHGQDQHARAGMDRNLAAAEVGQGGQGHRRERLARAGDRCAVRDVRPGGAGLAAGAHGAGQDDRLFGPGRLGAHVLQPHLLEGDHGVGPGRKHAAGQDARGAAGGQQRGIGRARAHEAVHRQAHRAGGRTAPAGRDVGLLRRGRRRPPELLGAVDGGGSIRRSGGSGAGNISGVGRAHGVAVHRGACFAGDVVVGGEVLGRDPAQGLVRGHGLGRARGKVFQHGGQGGRAGKGAGVGPRIARSGGRRARGAV